MYNFPSAAPLGLIAAGTLLGLSGNALWHLTIAGSKRMVAVLTAGLMAIVGQTLLTTSIHLGLTQLAFSEAVARKALDLPETALWANIFGGLTVLVLAVAIVYMIIARQAIGTAGMITLFFAASTAFADMMLMRFFEDALALAVSVGWLATGVSFVAFLVTVAVVKIRAYGARQFDKGKLAGMDATAQYIPSNSR